MKLHIKGYEFTIYDGSTPLDIDITGFDDPQVLAMEANMMQADNGLYLPAGLICETYSGGTCAADNDEEDIPDDTALSWDEWNAKVDRLLRECGEEI